jgi:hypothetical protein
MKKVLLLTAVFGLLCSDIVIAGGKTKVKKIKRKTVKVHTGYKSPLYLSPTTSDIVNSAHPTSGVGKNSSDNYNGVINNGSMSVNGTYHNSGMLSKERK